MTTLTVVERWATCLPGSTPRSCVCQRRWTNSSRPHIMSEHLSTSDEDDYRTTPGLLSVSVRVMSWHGMAWVAQHSIAFYSLKKISDMICEDFSKWWPTSIQKL